MGSDLSVPDHYQFLIIAYLFTLPILFQRTHLLDFMLFI